MNARRAKKLAYSLAAGYLRSDMDNGCPQYSLIEEQKMSQEDADKVSKAMEEIITMLEMKGLERWEES